MKRLVAALAGALLSVSSMPAAGAGPGATDEKWALIVVVDNYQAPTKPAGGPRDADDLRQALLQNGWPEANIRTLVDGAATAANIRAGMDWLAERSSNTSFSVFHYTGHVIQKRGDADRDGEDIDEFLWSYDNVHIPDGELGGRMRALQGDAWVNVSGCEGGGFDDGISGPRRLFTASSQETEKSYADASGNSFFTGLLVREGLLYGAGDSDGNGTVSIHEAFAHAAQGAAARSANFKDGPQHPFLAGGDGSQWFLTPPAAPASASPLPGPVQELPLVKDLPLPPLPVAPALPPLPVGSSLLPK